MNKIGEGIMTNQMPTDEHQKRKKWKKPLLIALLRGRPEESVLVGCKVYAGPGDSPWNEDLNCYELDTECGGCSIITGT